MDDDRNRWNGSGKNGEPETAGRSTGSDGPHWYDELDGVFDGRDKKRTRTFLSRPVKIVLLCLGALLVLTAGIGVYALSLYTEVQDPQRILLDEVSFEQDYSIDDAFSENIVNIALLGFDRGWRREEMGEYLFRPDMQAVISIDFEREEIALVRIMRDSYVPIYGMNNMHDKINHSYFYGYYYGDKDDRDNEGIRYALRTMSNALGGIPLHYYVSVDMYSVIELVDAVGGIYFEVDETIYDLHWEIGRVLVPEGPQIMDGKTYLRYLQYRDAETGQDKGRAERQFELIRATYEHLQKEGRITDLPATYRIYKDYVETDLSYTQIAALAYFARNLDPSPEILNLYSLPGGGQMKDGAYYFVLDQEERVRIIKEVFGVDVTPWPRIVLEDSPEYLAEQEQKRREEAREEARRDREEDSASRNSDRVDTDRSRRDDDAGSGNASRGDESDEQGEDGDTGRDEGTVMVPDLWGKEAEEALELLKKNGLKPGEIITRYYNHLQPGLVFDSNPRPGSRVYPGQVVNLVVSRGPEPSE